MNTTIKLLILAAVALAGLSACNQDNERAFYDESAPVAYSFRQPIMNAELTTAFNGVLPVVIARTKATEAASIEIKFTATAAVGTLFTLASPTVSFAAGAYEASTNVQFTLDNLAADGSQYQFTLEFNDPTTPVSEGGNKKTDVKAGRKLTWINAGEGAYESAAYGNTYKVEFETAIEAPGLYKMIEFFTNPILIQVNSSTGKAIIPAQDLGEDIFGVGTNSWIECSNGTYANGIITFGGGTWDNAFYTSAAQTSGLRMTSEKFHLPAGSY